MSFIENAQGLVFGICQQRCEKNCFYILNKGKIPFPWIPLTLENFTVHIGLLRFGKH